MQNTDKTSPEEVREAMDKLGWSIGHLMVETGMGWTTVHRWLRVGGTPLIRAFLREAMEKRKYMERYGRLK